MSGMSCSLEHTGHLSDRINCWREEEEEEEEIYIYSSRLGELAERARCNYVMQNFISVLGGGHRAFDDFQGDHMVVIK